MSFIKRQQTLDLLHGSIWNKLPLFALPVAATGMLEQLFNASDVAIVGNFAHIDRTVAIAAVGANGPIVGVILNFFIGISLGINVVIAHAIGRQDKKAVGEMVQTAVLAALIGGVLVAAVGELCIAQVLQLLQVPEAVLPYALLYIRIYLLGLPVIFLYNFEAAIFRSSGDTKTPLLALAFSGCLNVLLNLFFVLVFEMSVDGVAIATVLANVVSASLLLVKLLQSDGWIHLQLENLRIHRKWLVSMLRIGLPAGVQAAVFNVANLVIQAAINSLGTTVIAASSAALNIEMMVYYLFNAFGQACTTFVGQNVGAGQLSRCRRTLALCLLEDALAVGVAIALILSHGPFLLSLFNSDSQVIALGYERLVLVFVAYFFSMLYEVMSGYMRGFGISLLPAVLTTIGVCGTRIAWVYVVFAQDPNFHTLLLAFPVSLALTAVLIFGALVAKHPARRAKGARAE